MRWFRMPLPARIFYRKALWHIPSAKECLYITFDDGPSESTPQLLELLEQFNIRATFFCLGAKVKEYRENYQLILQKGHTTAIHGYHHWDGWKCKLNEYIENVNRCQSFISSKLYRPPYGKMTYRQYRVLSKKYKIVMWDVMTYDFDQSISDEQFISKTLLAIRKGSIVVLHDNPDTIRRINLLIPSLCNHFPSIHFNVLNED